MILYIHIPFCTSKCGYCAFNSSDSLFELQEAYVEALLIDLKDKISNQTFSSIYFGGGTPNTLESHHYERIFALIFSYAKLSQDCEITLECNPNLITKSWCEVLKDLGANRISLGVQSFFKEKLDFLQRDHSRYDIFKSIEIIRQSGISNISLDLIYNTPFDSIEFLSQEIAHLAKLDISHLSAYALSIDRGSKFFKAPPKLAEKDYSFEIREMLKEKGLIQYEVSSYFKTQKSRHNLSYWRGEDYIGCGAGGVGCLEGVRQWGHKHIPSYIKDPIHRFSERLSIKEKRLERIFLGLRCEIGISLEGLCPQKVAYLLEEGKCFLKRVDSKIEDYDFKDTGLNEKIDWQKFLNPSENEKLQGFHLVASDFFLADEIALYLD